MRPVAISGPPAPRVNVPMDFEDNQLGIDWGKLAKRLGRAAQAYGMYKYARQQQKAAEAAAVATPPTETKTQPAARVQYAGFAGSALPLILVGVAALFLFSRKG